MTDLALFMCSPGALVCRINELAGIEEEAALVRALKYHQTPDQPPALATTTSNSDNGTQTSTGDAKANLAQSQSLTVEDGSSADPSYSTYRELSSNSAMLQAESPYQSQPHFMP